MTVSKSGAGGLVAPMPPVSARAVSIRPAPPPGAPPGACPCRRVPAARRAPINARAACNGKCNGERNVTGNVARMG
ncbi:hypothetical protein Kpho02_04760 [Kitasatospora phosalacinea]|uniref:Uncharacterized protein n=1 Tax=Kitasatospora phosalacinea TaxID=2065 RepID=A0A9W6V0E6_9ACTN|nr:hypothetical protein Kpho02_04760 [Kitasatospora phosalacinea]